MREEDKKYFLALPDWGIMGLCIEREAGGEPDEGKIAVGTVILERVDRQGWMGKTIHEVIMKPWQFSWTMEEAGKLYYEESVIYAKNFERMTAPSRNINLNLKKCCSIAQNMLSGKIERDLVLHKFNCCLYLNPQKAGKTYRKWLEVGCKPIKTIGGHVFFDDHKGIER